MIIQAPNEEPKPMSKCSDCVLLEGGIRLCKKHTDAAKRETKWMAGWAVTRN